MTTFTNKAVTNSNVRILGSGVNNPDRPKPQESLELGGLDTFIAGQFTYNPIVAGVSAAVDRFGSDETPVENYNPFDNVEDLAGYPLEMFSKSDSPNETSRLKREYEKSLYARRVLEESGTSGVMSSVAAGAMNPLYMVPYLRIGSSARYLKSAADAAAGEAITESLYQGLDLDRTRTVGESVFNIAAGATVGGILGGYLRGGSVTKAERDQIVANLEKEYSFVGPRTEAVATTAPADISSAARDPSPLDAGIGTLASVPGVDRIAGTASRALSKLTPLRVLASPSTNARRMGALLGEQTVVGTSRAAVETLVKGYDQYLGKALTEVGSHWKQFTRSPEGSNIQRHEFGELIADAMRAGDVHPNPHVEAAAKKIRRELMEPVRKNAVDAGIYPADKDLVKFSKGYFPRMYNFDLISANLGKFRDDLHQWLRNEYSDFTEDELMNAAREISQTIRQKYNGHNALSASREFTASALKGRKVPVPDSVLRPWLINDPDVVLRAWSHNMATQTEMTKMFGGTDLSKYFKEIEDEWDDIITEASKTNPQKASELQKKKNDDITTLEALRDRLLNRYKMPDNPSSGWVRAGKATRNLNVIRLLGGMTLSAFPDLARPLYRNGFISYAKAIRSMTAGSKEFKKMTKADMKRSSVAMDMILNQRMRAITEMDYIPSIGRGGYVAMAENALERSVMGRAGKLDFGKLTLMSPWNATMKGLSFLMSQDGLIAHTMNPVKNAKKLKRAGIDEDMARRIRDQYKQFGAKDGGLRTSNFDEWTDLEAAELFESVLLKEVDGTIITPGIMDKPLWTSSEFGKFLSQFKSFAFAATNKQLIAGMNNFDGMFVQGTLVATALGSATWSMKRKLAGYDDTEMNPEELLLRGIEYSGVIGYGSDLVSMGAGVASAAGVYKGDGNFRWARKGLMGSIAGPGVGLLVDDLPRVPRALFVDEPNGGDVEAIRRILPYNNLFYVRPIFDAAEQGVKDHLNIVD